MRDYLIERHIPGVGGFDGARLQAASAKSNAALAALAPGIEWVSSFVAGDKTICHYRADGEDRIREHARLSGFPATSITPVDSIIGPATGGERC